MIRSNVQRSVRLLRRTKGWRQLDLGAQAGVSREIVSRMERGDLSGMTLKSVESVAHALGASVLVQLHWRGEQLDRLLDAAHAAMQAETAGLLTRLGWTVRVEVSFNHFGNRGRIDIVAFHPRIRVLLVVEIKSVFGDLQETLGRLDVKARLSRTVARELGWHDVAAVVAVLVIGDSRQARRTVAAHDALFERHKTRGRRALAWLRRPLPPIPAGLLWFATRPDSHQASVRNGQRVRKRPDSHRM